MTNRLLILLTVSASVTVAWAFRHALRSQQANELTRVKAEPWQQRLRGPSLVRAVELDNELHKLQREDIGDRTIAVAEELLSLRLQWQPDDHWEVADARRSVELLTWISRQPEDLRRRVAQTYAANTEGFIANRRGDYVRAESLLRPALVNRVRLFGEGHPEVAEIVNNLAISLDGQGRWANAAEHHIKALQIWRATLGNDHPRVALSSQNFARNLKYRGHARESEQLYRESLRVRRNTYGPLSEEATLTLGNLAALYSGQEYYVDAVPLQRRVIARSKRLGLSGLVIVASTNLASSLSSTGEHLEAQRVLRDLASLPVDKRSPQSARLQFYALSNLAMSHLVCGELPQAAAAIEEAKRAGATVIANAAGGLAPQEAVQFDILKGELAYFQDNLEDSRLHLDRAVDGYESARRISGKSGEERQSLWLHSPHLLLAAVLARQGKAAEASFRLDAYYARTLLDDLDKRFPSINEMEKREVSGAPHAATPAANGVAGAPSDPIVVQKYLPANTVLVAWLDIEFPKSANRGGEHWLCVIGDNGPPTWLRLASGDQGKAWEAEDRRTRARLRTFLVGNSGSATAARETAQRLYELRLRPLEVHLEGLIGRHPVEHLIVIPNRAMAGLPLEVLLESQRWQPRVSYTCSANAWAKMKERGARRTHSTLKKTALVFGDPTGTSEDIPWTKAETAAIVAVTRDPVLLRGDQASLEALETVRRGEGGLRRFEFAHFAGHGGVDETGTGSYIEVARSGGDGTAGRMRSASQMSNVLRLTDGFIRRWELEARVVSVGVCKGGATRNVSGESYLGLGQALLVAGAQSVVLALWDVDDAATAFLMTRLYQNLTGKRAGLAKPMAQATALAEAKSWLRTLTPKEILLARRELASVAGLAEEVLPLPDVPNFSHPRYWAGFVLVGDGE